MIVLEGTQRGIHLSHEIPSRSPQRSKSVGASQEQWVQANAYLMHYPAVAGFVPDPAMIVLTAARHTSSNRVDYPQG